MFLDLGSHLCQGSKRSCQKPGPLQPLHALTTRSKKLRGAPGRTTRNKGLLASLLGARTLLGAMAAAFADAACRVMAAPMTHTLLKPEVTVRTH